MQCKGRYCREKQELKFPLRSGYFTERRCQNIALGQGCDPELCETCQDKSRQPWVNKNQQSRYQGKVDQPYHPQSWLFGAERFLKYNAMPGNTLSKDVYEYAETAQRIAQKGCSIPEMPRKSQILPEPVKTEVVNPPVQEKKKAGRKPKTETVVARAPAPAPAPTPVIVARKKVAKKATVPIVPPPQPSEAKLYESLEEPIEAIEVVKIPIQLKTIQETQYWYEPQKQKVYERKKDGSIGTYQGRYNRAEDKIQSFPDSDKE